MYRKIVFCVCTRSVQHGRLSLHSCYVLSNTIFSPPLFFSVWLLLLSLLYNTIFMSTTIFDLCAFWYNILNKMPVISFLLGNKKKSKSVCVLCLVHVPSWDCVRLTESVYELVKFLCALEQLLHTQLNDIQCNSTCVWR